MPFLLYIVRPVGQRFLSLFLHCFLSTHLSHSLELNVHKLIHTCKCSFSYYAIVVRHFYVTTIKFMRIPNRNFFFLHYRSMVELLYSLSKNLMDRIIFDVGDFSSAIIKLKYINIYL